MTAKIEFFPVGKGDMTLMTLESGRKILIDVNIRTAADDENDDETIDVAALLRERLDRDADGRLYVDAFLLSHPDEDHCRGLTTHFHLGAPGNWSKKDDKILIREMWSSPIIFRRKKDVDGKVCADAQAWWDEARRRVNLYKSTASKASIKDGDHIQVLGEDKNGKSDGIDDILVKTGTEITKIGGKLDDGFKGLLLGPRLVSKEEAETLTGKNHSSTIIRFTLKGGTVMDACRFLTCGDAEVENWERVWARNKSTPENLSYDVLLVPHHCSWHALSYDSWSDLREKAEVSKDARQALSQARDGASLIASCNEIKDDKNDPPCIGAKREYEAIAASVKGTFLCTDEECDDEVLLISIDGKGPRRGDRGGIEKATFGGGSSGTRMTDKQGGGRYA
ncbi:metallohydrolase [Dyella sp.]|uniref:metallohydrolase n=1 Tax=Dyella sp. TaxID=1869338 RepID=UPI002B483BBE|nr:metallohydrolase [Dyella sp.]HKT29158.1 metallohydrolase [Dyella sp.]